MKTVVLIEREELNDMLRGHTLALTLGNGQSVLLAVEQGARKPLDAAPKKRKETHEQRGGRAGRGGHAGRKRLKPDEIIRKSIEQSMRDTKKTKTKKSKNATTSNYRGDRTKLTCRKEGCPSPGPYTQADLLKHSREVHGSKFGALSHKKRKVAA